MKRPRSPDTRGWWPRVGRRSLLGFLGASAALVPASAAPVDDRKQKIWRRSLDEQHVWGYADKHSVVPGERFDLRLSTGPGIVKRSGRIEFFRIGNHPDGQKRIWASALVTAHHQPVSLSAPATGANWDTTIESIDTSTWPPGYYSGDFVHARTGVREPQLVQIVVRNPKQDGKVLLKLGTNTYQAYNSWGGYSLYPDKPVEDDIEYRGTIVSFDRPTPPAFFQYDVYLVRWLEALGERLGISIDYATNFDAHLDASLIRRYPLVACSAHDEYWSKEEFDAFERRIFQAGRNTIFYGANTAYWQMRYADVDRPPKGEDRGRQMVTYKSLIDPIAWRAIDADPRLLVSARFRDGARRPETMLMGIGYDGWFPFDADQKPTFSYAVVSTDMPFFEGTGYRTGDRIADIVGYEWDNRDPEGDGHRLWRAGRSRIAELPRDRIKVLFRGAPINDVGKPRRAEAVFFESAAGAKVFSSGTVRWSWGLGKPGIENERFKRFNENLVRAFLA
ncbi:MAG TPA: N,N-dimethylformamidase beta subunit family domain-containing protein [Stellaceae bacterium]|nr:N,N-dimethylformamidase beta subunit family domain-containing protein [Stellaceae bacterium]